MPKLVCVDGSASKFWEAKVVGATLTLRWGRIGTDGQAKDKVFESPAAADHELAKLLREKLAKGYVDESPAAPIPQASDKSVKASEPTKKASKVTAKPPEAAKKPSKKVSKKAADEVVPGTASWRDVPPLSIDVSDDEAMNGVIDTLQRGLFLTAEQQVIFRDASVAKFEALLTPVALDLGECSWDQGLFDALEGRERKAYNKRFESIDGARRARVHFLGTIAEALARSRTTERRVLQLALQHPSAELRGRVATYALLAYASDDTLAGLIEALEWEGPFVNPDVRTAATTALLRTTRGSAEVFERLAPYFERCYDESQMERARAMAIAIGLGRDLPRQSDARWRPVFARLLSHPELQLYALPLYERVEFDATMEEALLAFVGVQLAIPFFNANLISLLARCRDRRASLLLARGYAHQGNQHAAIFEALRAQDEAASAPFLRASASALLKARKDKDNPVYAAAEDLARWLERNGTASEDQARALEQLPTFRLAGPPPKPMPMAAAESLPSATAMAQQRELLESMLKEAKLGKSARKILTASKVALCATSQRHDGELPLGSTRLGGAPDAPSGFAWPVVDGVTLAFVAQFDLAELARLEAAPEALPKRGALLFFVCDDFGDAPTAPGYLEVARVFYFDVDVRTLERVPVPKTLMRWVDGEQVNRTRPVCTLTFRSQLQLPPPLHPVMAALALGEDTVERYATDVFIAPKGAHQLLGFRRSDDYEARPLDSILLLQLLSDERAEMEWGDVADLCFYISAEALAARDFSCVVPSCGP